MELADASSRLSSTDIYLVDALRGLALSAQDRGANLEAFKYWSMVRSKRPDDAEAAAAAVRSARKALTTPFLRLRDKLAHPPAS